MTSLPKQQLQTDFKKWNRTIQTQLGTITFTHFDISNLPIQKPPVAAVRRQLERGSEWDTDATSSASSACSTSRLSGGGSLRVHDGDQRLVFHYPLVRWRHRARLRTCNALLSPLRRYTVAPHWTICFHNTTAVQPPNLIQRYMRCAYFTFNYWLSINNNDRGQRLIGPFQCSTPPWY